jgi:hypothetical protein
MPKKVPRNNPAGRSQRTVHSAATLLQRIRNRAGGQAMPHVAPASTLLQLKLLLPEELRPHLLQVLEKPGELVLFADSAVWAGRLKLMVTALAPVAAGRRQVVRLLPPGGSPGHG